MSAETIAMAAAGLGVLFSVGWMVLGILGVGSLRNIADRMERGNEQG